MKIKFELDVPADVPVSRSQILELGRTHRIPYIILTMNIHDANPLPSEWYLHGDIFFRSTKEQAESLEQILHRVGSCEILELQESRYVSNKTNGS